MIKNVCKHSWQRQIDTQVISGNSIPAYFVCEKCQALMTAAEVFQLEALENQNETLRHLKGFQSNISFVTVAVSFIALIISIFKK